VPELLRGMLAFGVWDGASEIPLARDRFGEKPLYYAERPDGFVFASEPGVLLADELSRPSFRCRPSDALALQYVSSPDTIYEGIKELPAGHTLEEPLIRWYSGASCR
jgi:asparagine synthase (glutamine-hydrolysing)